MENAKRLEALEAKRKQLDAQIQALRVREQTQARKDDTRRKVLIGGVMLPMVKLDEMPEGRLTQLLDKHLDAERDRKLFGLEPKQPAQPYPLPVAQWRVAPYLPPPQAGAVCSQRAVEKWKDPTGWAWAVARGNLNLANPSGPSGVYIHLKTWWELGVASRNGRQSTFIVRFVTRLPQGL